MMFKKTIIATTAFVVLCGGVLLAQNPIVEYVQ